MEAQSLPRPFEGDRSVDLRDRQNLPSQEVRNIVGDLSKPENITFPNAVKCFAEAIHRVTIQTASKGEIHLTDGTYAMNAFGFITDNLVQLGNLSEDQRRTLDNFGTLLSDYIKTSNNQ